MAEAVGEVATKDINKELSFQKWFAKIIERGTMVLQCIKDRTVIKLETDWDVIEMLHADWFTGKCIMYETITVPDLSKATQPDLFNGQNDISFDDARDKILDGTISDSPCVETKKKKKK
jgi:hypothetical protein